ncbi:MAG: hypothetical protein ACW98U_16645 [Candidatus Thorarchaeota archaeon]|jgi:hypothetical protein
MACTAKQQTIPLMETSEPIEYDERIVSVDIEIYDDESRKLRKHLAQQEALRQLERRKTLALATAHRVSFLR